MPFVYTRLAERLEFIFRGMFWRENENRNRTENLLSNSPSTPNHHTHRPPPPSYHQLQGCSLVVGASATTFKSIATHIASIVETAVACTTAGMESSGHAAAAQDSLQQAEFLAEDELIEISPMVVAGTVQLVSGDFGPFEPSIAIAVPLWLALAMKKLRRCHVLPPRWLTVAEVERVLQLEREREDALQEIPHFFFQIAAVLLHRAEDDLQAPGRLRRSVEDLSSIRAGKLRRWMQANVRDRTNALKIQHLTSLEVESHRPVLPRVLNGLSAMVVPALETDPLTETTSGATTSAANTSSEPQRPVRRIIRRT